MNDKASSHPLVHHLIASSAEELGTWPGNEWMSLHTECQLCCLQLLPLIAYMLYNYNTNFVVQLKTQLDHCTERLDINFIANS